MLLGGPTARAGGGPENVLVVVNDLCEDSWAIARSYLHQQDVPRHHVFHVRIPGAPSKQAGGPETYRPVGAFPDGYDGFRRLLLDPVKEWIEAHPRARITTILLTRGIPLVTAVKDNPDVTRGTAHMLAILAVESDQLRTATKQMAPRRNPIHGTDRSIDPREPENETPIYAVGILDAYTLEDVDGMIQRSIQSDRKRPKGTVYLGRSAQGDPRGQYNGAFRDLAEWILGLPLPAEIVEHPGTKALLDGKKGTWVLRAKAEARRENAGIQTMRLYVDGVLRGENPGDSAEFEVEGFDPGKNRWRCVAVDDSRFRAQGALASEPLPKKVRRVKVSLRKVSKGKATFKVAADRTAVFTWACASAKGRTGTGKGRSFSLELEGDSPHVVDTWIRNAGGLAAFTIQVPLRGKGRRR